MNEINNSDNLDYSAPPRSFIEAIKVCFTKYAVFKGRASRSEFWWFFLFGNVCNFVLTISMEGTILGLALLLAVFVPYCAAGVRRFHDINLSGAGFIGLLAVMILSVLVLETDFGDEMLLLLLFTAICAIVWLSLCATPGGKQKNKYNLPTDVGQETTR